MILLISSICVYTNAASIVSLRGNAEILRDNSSIDTYLNATISENDNIITKSNANVQIKFIYNTKVTLGTNSTFDINTI